MKSQRGNWWIFRRQAENDGRFDGKLNIPDASWTGGRTPALLSMSACGRARQSQVGTEWYPRNADHEERALGARRDLAAARRDLDPVEARVLECEKRATALESKARTLPHRIAARFVYWALLVVSTVGEFPILASALLVTGEPQQVIWMMALAIGGLLFVAAHLVGAAWSKAHSDTAGRKSAVAQAIGILALAIGFILAFGMLRAGYLTQVQQQLGLGTRLSAGQAFWPFVLMQMLVFGAACVASRHRHDYLASAEYALGRDVRTARRALRQARRELDGVRERELDALKTIDSALCRRENEFNKKIEEAAVQRYLDEALMWRYRTTNLRERKPPLPPVFATHPVPDIETATWMSRDYSLDRLGLDRRDAEHPAAPRQRTRPRTRRVPNAKGGTK